MLSSVLKLEARDVLGQLHSGVSPSVAACGFNVSENSALNKVSLNRNMYTIRLYIDCLMKMW